MGKIQEGSQVLPCDRLLTLPREVGRYDVSRPGPDLSDSLVGSRSTTRSVLKRSTVIFTGRSARCLPIGAPIYGCGSRLGSRPATVLIVVGEPVSWRSHRVRLAAPPDPLPERPIRLRRPWTRWFYANMRTIPVDRASRDPGWLRAALRALHAQEVVGIFPEGAGLATGPSREPKPGAGLLACMSGAPLVPAAVIGTWESWPPTRRLPKPIGPFRFGERMSPGRGRQTWQGGSAQLRHSLDGSGAQLERGSTLNAELTPWEARCCSSAGAIQWRCLRSASPAMGPP